MNKRDVGFTQGCGCAIHYVSMWDFSIAENLFKELNIPLSDYEDVCEEIDLEVIRKVAPQEIAEAAEQPLTNATSGATLGQETH